MVTTAVATLAFGSYKSRAVVEVEPNDTSKNRPLLANGTTEVTGHQTAFDPVVSDHRFSDELTPGQVVFLIPGETPGTPFVAWIDNEVGFLFPDTVMGTYADATFDV